MFITKKHLRRRTFLQGVGAAVALPLLDAMVPAFASNVKQTPRLGFVYVPHGMDAYAGVTADQIAAQAIGQDTLLPSLEIATEDHSGLIGACDRDYGCIYMNTLSWRTPTTPLPMEINPRKVFERMFGQGSNAAERAMRKQQDRSILDGFMQQATSLQKKLDAHDRATVNDYLDSVREIERRIQRTGVDQTNSDVTVPPSPAGIPYSY